MLKLRLLFGALMTVFFSGLVVLDGWLDGSLTGSPEGRVQGTILMVLVAVIIALGGIELSRLAASRGLIVLNPVCTVGLVSLATAWYWPQFLPITHGTCLLLAAALTLAGVMITQHARFGTQGVLANCGASCFVLAYLGLLSAFVLGIRIEAGLWPTLMYFFAVKAADIGAYSFGKLFGRHKFAPRISPGKTWEGMAGAVIAAAIISIAFSAGFGIMGVWPALLFGAAIAFVGQLSDLSESMLKRDAGQKDSSNRVPGFGGILDVIDSPLFAAPFAYAFFTLAMR